MKEPLIKDALRMRAQRAKNVAGLTDEEKKEVKAHRTTTRPQQYASLVRRIQANGDYQESCSRRAKG